MANELDIKTQQAIENISTLEKNVLSLLDSLEMVEKQAKDVNSSFKSGNLADYNKAQKESVELQTKLAKKLFEVEKLRTQEQRTLNVLARTQATNNRERDRAIDRQNKLAKSTATQKKRTQEANREFKKLEAELLRVTKAYQDMAIKEGFASKNTQRLLADVKRLRGEVDKIQKPIGNFQRNVGNYGSALKGVASAGLAAAGIVGFVDTVIRIGESAFDTTRELDSLNNSLLAVFETEQQVAKEQEFLTKISEDYGLEVINLTKSYKSFSASVKGTLVEGEKARKIFDSVTKASAVMGLTTEQTEGALRALEQMMSKGTVQAEELRGQLGERIPSAFSIFADGLGVTTSELNKMLEKGEVLAEDTLPKFAVALEKAYNLDTIDRVETLNASISRSENAFTNFVKSIESGEVTLSSLAQDFFDLKTLTFNWLTEMNKVEPIEKQQKSLNNLALELKNNLDNNNKRIELIKEINALNPNLLNGLDKENLSYEAINENLKKVNEQYAQKLALLKFEDELNELYSEQATRLKNIAEVTFENSEFLNTLNKEQKQIIDLFIDGDKTFKQAVGSLTALGVSYQDATTIVKAYDNVLRAGFDTSEGWVRSQKDVSKEIENTKSKIEVLNGFIKKTIDLNGDLTNGNIPLIDSMNQFNDTIEFGNRLLASRLAISKGDFVGALVALAPEVEEKPNPSGKTGGNTETSKTSSGKQTKTSNRSSNDAQKEKIKLLQDERKELEKINKLLNEASEFYGVALLKDVLEKSKETAKEIENRLDDTLNTGIENTSTPNVDIEGDNQKKELERLNVYKDIIAEGLSDLGLDAVANQFTNLFDTILNEQASFTDKLLAGFAVVGTFASQMFEKQADDRIESLERENEAFQEDTDLKIEAIERQLQAENLSAEEKEALEAQIEVFEAQKEQKEKQTKIRQFKAQQKADAQQALINGALGATQTIARLGVPFGIAPAGIALAFGALQSALILSKAVPEFGDGGRLNGALHKDGGVPIVAKGTNTKIAEAEGGEWIINRKSSQKYDSILNDINNDVLDDNLLNSMILNRLIAPTINIDNAITEEQIYNAVDRAMSKNTQPTYFNDGKNLYVQSNGKYPKTVKKMHNQKNSFSIRTKYN